MLDQRTDELSRREQQVQAQRMANDHCQQQLELHYKLVLSMHNKMQQR
jgi:hypothetical protein